MAMVSHSAHHQQKQAYSSIEPEAYSDDNNEHACNTYVQTNSILLNLLYSIIIVDGWTNVVALV